MKVKLIYKHENMQAQTLEFQDKQRALTTMLNWNFISKKEHDKLSRKSLGTLITPNKADGLPIFLKLVQAY